jgi:alpha-L-fucosidase
MPFYTENASFYQDRLGTNIGKALKKRDAFLAGGNLLLNLAPPINTTIPDQAMRMYAQLGNWTRRCYGESAMAAPSVSKRIYISCAILY